MRKVKKNEKKNKNLHLGFYFALLVIFIIVISVVFKVLDTVKKSKFDGNNFFTLAIVSGKNTEVISVSPKEGTIKKLSITGAGSEESLKLLGVPFDSISESKDSISEKPKSYFSKLLLHQNSLKSSLTTIDLIRLFIFAQRVDSGKIYEDSTSQENAIEFSALAQEWFLDPEIAKENKSIEITNNTSTPGLGNKIAKIVSNTGGRVVLVNSSQDSLTKSVIYYGEDSYTVGKLSKIFDIPTQKKELSSISDIIISIGEDKANF